MSGPAAGWTAIETTFQSRQTSRGKSASAPLWAIVTAALSRDWKCNYFYLWKYSWEFSPAHCCTRLDKLATERLKRSGADALLMHAVGFQSSRCTKRHTKKILKTSLLKIPFFFFLIFEQSSKQTRLQCTAALLRGILKYVVITCEEICD